MSQRGVSLTRKHDLKTRFYFITSNCRCSLTQCLDKTCQHCFRPTCTQSTYAAGHAEAMSGQEAAAAQVSCDGSPGSCQPGISPFSLAPLPLSRASSESLPASPTLQQVTPHPGRVGDLAGKPSSRLRRQAGPRQPSGVASRYVLPFRLLRLVPVVLRSCRGKASKNCGEWCERELCQGGSSSSSGSPILPQSATAGKALNLSYTAATTTEPSFAVDKLFLSVLLWVLFLCHHHYCSVLNVV